VRRANVRRSEAAPLRIEPEAGQFPENAVEAQGNVPSWVLQHDESRLHFANDARNVRPEVPLVGLSESLTGNGEWLAWVTHRHQIHDAAPASTVEAGNVIPHRSIVQGAFAHVLDEDRGGVEVILDPAHGSQPGPDSAQPEFEPGHTGT
jgi:hypothetical protein